MKRQRAEASDTPAMIDVLSHIQTLGSMGSFGLAAGIEYSL
jgi:hypothetical protein